MKAVLVAVVALSLVACARPCTEPDAPLSHDLFVQACTSDGTEVELCQCAWEQMDASPTCSEVESALVYCVQQ